MPRIARRTRPFRNRPARQGRTRRTSRFANVFADHRCTDELSIIVDRLSS
ncbi:MAG: hypothetical protein AB7L17_02140 [Ilumatobacteraceae bacterium]|jgi:hypothetical protein